MAKELSFDEYDCSRNERGFTAEELETVRRLLSVGKRVWMAPVVIDDEGQLDTLYVSRSRCRTWQTGPEKRLVYLTPADEATYLYLKSEIESKRKREERNRRCLIPGTRNDYVRCPECYHCSECPFGKGDEARTGRFVSRDCLMETDLETAVSFETPEDIVLRQEMLSEIRERMRQKSERILQAFEMKMMQGYDVQEVADAMGESKRNAYFFLSEAKRICEEYSRQELPD